jgi:hypothetical protein
MVVRFIGRVMKGAIIAIVEGAIIAIVAMTMVGLGLHWGRCCRRHLYTTEAGRGSVAGEVEGGGWTATNRNTVP